MAAPPAKLIESSRARRALSRLTTVIDKVTCRIPRGTPAQTIEAIDARRGLSEQQRQSLTALGDSKAGAAFIDEKVDDINRAAFHRSAFVLNALTQALFVDITAPMRLSLPQLKVALVVANLLLAAIAHLSMRRAYRALLAGPQALPPKRRLWGLLSNPRYNKAVKKYSRPYARSAWREKSLYRPAYFINALLIFLGSQFIIAPEKLLFPLSFIIDKVTGLITMLVLVFDLWRGVRAGDDSRRASEKQVSVYKNLDI